MAKRYRERVPSCPVLLAPLLGETPGFRHPQAAAVECRHGPLRIVPA